MQRSAIGLLLVVLAVAPMLGRRFCVCSSRPAHIEAVVQELAAVGKLMLPIPLPNTAGNKLLFGQSTVKGVGVFLLNAANGQKQLVYEQPRKFYDPAKFRIFGWAPDDSLFAFQEHDAQKWAGCRIAVCDGTTGKVNETVNVDGRMIDGNWVFGITAGFCWLSPHSFAYVRILGTNVDLVTVEQAGGKWDTAKTFKLNGNKPPGMLVATRDHSVVWQEGNTLKSMDTFSGSTTQIFHTTNELEEFFYSPVTEKFLLLCANQFGDDLYEFQPGQPVLGEVRGSVFTNLCRISHRPHSVAKALWLNHGNGIAYTIQDRGQETLMIKSNAAAIPVALGERGSIISFNVSGNHLFIAGSLTNAPPGIWRLDLNDGTFNCVYCSQEHPFQYAKYIAPLCKTITNGAGMEITYHVWEPPMNSPSQKRPVLLSQSPFNWQVYPELSANGGDFFINVDRPSFLCPELGNWAEDVMAVRAELAKDQRIDTNAFYIFGSSAESAPLASLVDQNPSLWQGIILITPEFFPQLSGINSARILVDEGADDESTMGPILKYQQAAAAAGVPLTLSLHKDTAHIYWSMTEQREEAQQLARFLFGN